MINIPKNIFTDKAKDIYHLQTKGLNTPVTLIIREFDASTISNYLHLSQSRFHYYRISIIDETIINSSAICEEADLVNKIRDDINRLSSDVQIKFEIIAQPLINFEFSGVVIVHSDYVLIEVVYGHPISLLRKGQIKFRFLFDKLHNLIDFNELNQQFSLTWVDNELIMSDLTDRQYSIDFIISLLNQIDTTENRIYEFGVRAENIIYLESKSFNRESYIESLTVDGIQKPFIVFKNEIFHDNPTYIETPLLEATKLISPDKSFYVGSGPYLAHFATYCAIKSVNCIYLS